MIKLIATDMDGTFLNNNHEVSAENIAAVKYVENKNIDFIIATGRAYYEAIIPLEKANIKCDMLCFNGGISYDKNGKITNIIKLEQKDAEFATHILKDLGISYQFYTKESVYTTDMMNDVQAYVDLIEGHGAEANREQIIAEAKERQAKGHLVEVDSVDDYINISNNPLIKIIAISNDKEKLKLAKEQLAANSELSVTSSGENNIEIMNKNVTKGKALKTYAEQRNISLEETVALGDNMNDYAMLEVANYSVAMKNGNDTLKKIAKYISDKSNDESGAGAMIIKLIEEYNEV